MTSETAMVQPTNKITVDSKNLHIQTKKVETVDNVYPGRMVKKGTNDDDIQVCTAKTDMAIGYVGYTETAKKYRPATIDTIQVQYDQVTVCNGPGVIFLGLLEKGATVVKGRILILGAIGGFSGGAATDMIYAIAEETVNATAGALDILVRLLV